MNTIRILPKGTRFQVIETDGEARILFVRSFPTKQAARKWAASRLEAQDGPRETLDDAAASDGGSITIVSVVRDEPKDLDAAIENDGTIRVV